MVKVRYLEIKPVRKRFWWPHPYARPWLWRSCVIGYRYFHNGVECDRKMFAEYSK